MGDKERAGVATTCKMTPFCGVASSVHVQLLSFAPTQLKW